MEKTLARDAGRSLAARGLWFAARESLEAWRQSADVTGDHLQQVRADHGLGMVALGQARWQDALAHFDRAYDLAQPIASPDLLARLAFNRGQALADGYQVKEALSAVEQALPYCQVEPRPETLAAIQFNLGAYRLMLGDHAQACPPLEAAHQLYQGLGRQDKLAAVLCNLGICRLEAGDAEGAGALLAEGAARAETTDLRVYGYICTELGRVALAKGDAATAIAFGSRSLDTLWANVSNLSKDEVARVCALFGEAARLSGDTELARRFLERAAIYFGQLSLWREYIHTQDSLTALLRQGAAAGNLALPADAVRRLEYFVALLGLLDEIESVYPHLRLHGEWLTHYSLLLGRAVGCDDEELAALSHAARLCDIGLTPLEEAALAQGDAGERYRMHPTMSEQWLVDFPLPPGCLATVRQHHENWDGSGYPDGLTGGASVRTARIIRLCHMYLETVQRQGHGPTLALLQAEAERRLDPDLVAAFVQMHHA